MIEWFLRFQQYSRVTEELEEVSKAFEERQTHCEHLLRQLKERSIYLTPTLFFLQGVPASRCYIDGLAAKRFELNIWWTDK